MKYSLPLAFLVAIASVEAVAVANPGAHENEKRQWCSIRGQSCWKAKRAAEAVVSAIDSVNEVRDVPFDPIARAKREANPEALAEASCNSLTGACTKASRDLHAMYNMARNIVDAYSE